MADLFCSFLDFRPLHTSYKLHVVLPSKRLSSTHVYSPSSRIHRIYGRPFHLKLFFSPSAPTPTPSSIDVVSTDEHSDGSLVFRFGEPGEAASNVQMEEPNVEKKEIEREGNEDELVVNVLSGDNDGGVKDFSLAEVTDESNSTTASNVHLKDSSTQGIDMEDTGNTEEYLNDEQENSSMKSVSPNFGVISTHEHSDGSLIFRFGDLSESASNAQLEESKVDKDIEEEGTEEDRLLTDLNGDDDGGVRNSSLAEVTDESTSIYLDGKNLSISEKENDLGERSKDATEFELPTKVSKAELKNFSTPGIDKENDGKDEECLNEERDSSRLMSVPMLANSSQIENSIAAVETPENNIVDVTMLQMISLSSDTLTESEKDTFQDSINTVVSTDLSADSKIGDDINNIVTVAHGIEAALQLSIDAEAQTSLEGNELRNKIVDDGSESGIIQLMPMSPQLETGQTIDEESVSGDEEEYRDTDKAESLKLLDDIPWKSILVSVSTEDDDNVNGDIMESSGKQVMEIEPTEVSVKSQEIQMTDFVLSSGAALLPHPSKVLTGGEDAYFVTGQTWLGVADGVGQWSFEGTNPGVYAQELIKNCEKLALDCNSNSICNPAELLKLSVGETQSPGSSTVLLAQLVGQVIQVANIGDSGFIILRHGSVYKRSSPMLHVFHFPLQIGRGDDPSNLVELYRIDLEEEDVIILASDGLLDNLHDQEIASEVSKYLDLDSKPEEIAEALAAKAQEVGKSVTARSPFADNAQAAGYAGYTGGKLDDVTVIVSVVQRQSSSQTL